MTQHLKGEWDVIRVDGITVAQGYRCSCGVIGCRQQFGGQGQEGRIMNDPAMTHCPECYKDGAIIKLVTTKQGKFCPHHGQITESPRKR